jgi:hypothetical protein
MNLDNIFNLFILDKEEYISHNDESQRLVDLFKEHPLVKIGMFKKLMRNYITNKKQLIFFFSSINKDLDPENIEKAGEYILYNKAWDYISCLDLTSEFHVETLKSVSSDELDGFLYILIAYFEQWEEYEKCNVLFNIKKEIMNNLKENLELKN